MDEHWRGSSGRAHGDGVRMPRRTFLSAAGAATLTAALGALPDALAHRGWLDDAAAETDLTRDTLNGLVAFVTPGDDPYSVAQGAATAGAGGIAAGTTAVMIALLDSALPAPLVGPATGATLPAAGGVAQLLNGYALEVNAAAARGGFVSPFARLSFAEKAEVFRRFESDPKWEGSPIHNLAGLLPGVVALLAFSEAGVLQDGQLTATPVGWQLTGFSGPTDGWDEFQGYWGGRTAAGGAHRFVRVRHGRGGSGRRAARSRRRA